MIRINMMAGKRNWGPSWVHIDGGNFHHINSHNTRMNVRPESSVDLIYCSHGIAYFSEDELINHLSWWKRVLKPGGILRLATPDFNVLSKLYQVGVELERIKGPLYGEMEMNGVNIYHKACYDEQTLSRLLFEAGFVNIRRYDHTKTEHPNTGNREDYYDDCSSSYINDTLISLNLECQKP